MSVASEASPTHHVFLVASFPPPTVSTSSRSSISGSLALGALVAAGGLWLFPWQSTGSSVQQPVAMEATEASVELHSAESSVDHHDRSTSSELWRGDASRASEGEILSAIGSIGGGGVLRAPPKGRYSYVIIGAGTTAKAALEAILQMHPDADILLLSDESVSASSVGFVQLAGFVVPALLVLKLVGGLSSSVHDVAP